MGGVAHAISPDARCAHPVLRIARWKPSFAILATAGFQRRSIGMGNPSRKSLYGAGASLPPAALAARGPPAPAAGRTSGRPCSCAIWRAMRVQTNQGHGASIDRRLGAAVSPEPALLAERRQDAVARAASSERKAGCLERASGRRGPAVPSLRDPRRGAWAPPTAPYTTPPSTVALATRPTPSM